MSTRGSAVSRRLAAGLGIAAVAVSVGGIYVAAALAPWFSPFRHALSHLGYLGTGTAPIFNGALILGGLLGAGFVVTVWEFTVDGIRAGALVVLLLSMLFMVLTGAFPLPRPMHSLVAVAFFAFMTLGLFIWGAGDFAAGRPTRGGAMVVASVLHVVSWFWWLLYGWGGPGIAIPELVGAVGLGIWALWMSVDLWFGGPGRSRV